MEQDKEVEGNKSTKEELPKPLLIRELGRMFATDTSTNKARYGLYKCGFCGTEFKTLMRLINIGRTKSCGCYKKIKLRERNITHNLTHTRLYNIWANIKKRTLDPKNKAYINYGGRGITICEEWLDVTTFYNWAMKNGYSAELTIDRIDNDKGYFPENCRWVNTIIQNRNKRMQKNNTSGYTGVNFNKSINKYQAIINVEKKAFHLGYFPTVELGAIAYNNYIIENNLEGFILNEIRPN